MRAFAPCTFECVRVLAVICVKHTFWRLHWGQNQSAAMAGKIPKPSDVDAANIQRPTVQQLSADPQKVLDGIRQKIREEKEKEIQKLEEEAMK